MRGALAAMAVVCAAACGGGNGDDRDPVSDVLGEDGGDADVVRDADGWADPGHDAGDGDPVEVPDHEAPDQEAPDQEAPDDEAPDVDTPTDPGPVNPGALVRICPMGDSITAANGEHASYRRPLWHALQELGANVDFVGSMNSNNTGPPPYDDYDWHNEGHGGYQANQLADRLPEWIQRYTPDIVLLHIGTNDLLRDDTPAGITQDISDIIDVIRARNPRAVILLAQIIGMTASSFNVKATALNAAIPGLAQRKSTAESPVVVVDHYTPFHPGTMTFDGTHPNDLGEQVIADTWLEALRPWLEP